MWKTEGARSRQYTTCIISALEKIPYMRQKASYGLSHFLRSPYGPAVWVFTLSQYRADGIILCTLCTSGDAVQAIVVQEGAKKWLSLRSASLPDLDKDLSGGR